jgi:hypothetical protein
MEVVNVFPKKTGGNIFPESHLLSGPMEKCFLAPRVLKKWSKM